jgi:hypothetical protein
MGEFLVMIMAVILLGLCCDAATARNCGDCAKDCAPLAVAQCRPGYGWGSYQCACDAPAKTVEIAEREADRKAGAK